VEVKEEDRVGEKREGDNEREKGKERERETEREKRGGWEKDMERCLRHAGSSTSPIGR